VISSSSLEICASYRLKHEGFGVCSIGARLDSLRCVRADSNRPAHFSRLLRLLRRKGRSREDAEDLIQEALLRLQVYAEGADVVNEEAFLRQTVCNLALDQRVI
jgi:hypothetical protein